MRKPERQRENESERVKALREVQKESMRVLRRWGWGETWEQQAKEGIGGVGVGRGRGEGRLPRMGQGKAKPREKLLERGGGGGEGGAGAHVGLDQDPSLVSLNGAF